ncbi:MAG: hypothetical protein ACO1PZ_11995 [Gammaproteobacteria bacterium]
MTFASPDEAYSETPLSPRRVAGSVAVSLLLHGAVVMLLARMVTNEDRVRVVTDLPSISVALVSRRQPEPLPPPAELPPQDLPGPQTEATPPPEISAETPESVAPAETEAETAEARDAVPASSFAETAPESDTQGRDAESRDRASDDEARDQPWTPARIRSALDANRREQQSETTANWLTDCIIEQKQHGTRDCTRQQQPLDYASESTRAGRNAADQSFMAVTRPQRHARLTEGFLKENALLEDMMEEGGVTGGIASQLFYINREYVIYLNGNGQEPLWGAMQNFGADTTHARPRPSLPGNILFTCRKRPCIYEWTGFTIERPDTNEADTFRVIPIVPGSRSREPATPVTP